MSTSIILRAIDLIWPPSRQKDPSKQKDPKIWALNHTAKYLVLNSAAQVRNLAKKGNTGPKYSNDDMKLASAPKQNLKELLLEVDKTQDSNALQPGLTSIMLGQTELAAHSLPLAKIGAELGLLWQKIGNGQGEQTSTPSPPFYSFIDLASSALFLSSHIPLVLIVLIPQTMASASASCTVKTIRATSPLQRSL